MKKILSFVAAALVLAGCQSDEFTANVNSGNSNEAICFGVNDVLATRGLTKGEQAAALLNNNFIVYGFKYGDLLNPTGEKADGTSDKVVFDRYNVNYEKGSANLTQSNSSNWEYAGFKSEGDKDQSVKYWDYSVEGYVFSAVSGLDITATKTSIGTTNVQEKGWTVTVPAGGTLTGLYASERIDVANEWSGSNKTFRYPDNVSLNFYAMASKVRFAIYETVPGYSVKIDRFYYTANTAAKYKYSATNFVADGEFKVLGTGDATATVTYYTAAEAATGVGIVNHPKVTWTGTDEKTALTFGANIQATTAIGTTSNTATYDQADNGYTYILPYAKADNKLVLKVDFTLTSTDGSNEKIYVHGATATVPANYTQWKENFAYTYIFKITDKVNGSTIPYDPGDPENPNTDPYNPYDPGDNPEGLSPITFDACVIAEEDGIQETVTTLGEPAITTYAEGEVATKNADYATGDVYFSATQAKALMDLSSAAKVYEVYNYGPGEITEALVEDYQKNKVVLVPVATTAATSVPLKDGSSLSFAATNCYKFTAAAGKTYAIQVNYNTTKYAYKIVKVAGTAADPTYTLTVKTSTSPVIATNGKVGFTLKSGTQGVVGALKNLVIYDGVDDVTGKFVITEGEPGKYAIALTDALIKEGANGVYTVKFNGSEQDLFEVDLPYALAWTGSTDTPAKPFVVVAGNKNTFTLTVNTAALAGAAIVNTNEGITVKETATAGTYEVSVAKDVAFGAYNLTVAGQPLTVNVDSYKFINDVTFTFNYEGTATPKTLYMTKNNVDADVEVADMTGINTSVATIAKASAGAYTVVPVHYGSYTVKYENASAKITVNQYTLTAEHPTVAKSTGSTNITVKLNGETINASKAAITCIAKPTDASYSLATNGKVLSFGNATKTGDYKFEYTVDGVKVARVTITVN